VAEDIEPTTATFVVPPPRAAIAPTGLPRVDVIKRTTAPQTKDGSRWEVELSAVPSREWLEFFKRVGEASASTAASPQPGRVTFDRASAVFRSDEHHVEEWIESLDKWIARAEARYLMSLDEADRERTLRLDIEARQRERIQQLNERFKNL
jgi:hypothetical protein